MNIVFLEKFRFYFIIWSNGANVSDSRLCRLLHHIAKLAGKHQLTFSWHYIDLDLKCISTYLCPCKTTGNTNLIFLICHKIIEMFFSKKIWQVLRSNCDFFLIFFHDQSRSFSADLTNGSLQISNSGFFCIIIDDLLKGCCLNRQLSLLDTILFHLFWNQMFFCNVLFLILCVACDLYQFHTVKKRSRDSLNIICSGNKQYLWEILWNFYIMIQKSAVLLRIKYLKKRCWGISFVITAGLIDFIKKHQRITYACLL